MTVADIAGYAVIEQAPTRIDYRGLDIYGMAPSSSGGTTVGESLNILENFDLSAANTPQSLHLYLEATAHAFADRNAYVGDPAFVDVPTEILLSQEFADARACEIDPNVASVKPVPAAPLTAAGCDALVAAAPADTENISTTHLSVVDKWGNAVAYTLTIESDRRLGHDRARPRVPAEQRAHRLQLHPRRRGSGFRQGSEHHRAGQAPSVVDVTDDRARRRRRPLRRRLARRFDDHHDGHAGADQPASTSE